MYRGQDFCNKLLTKAKIQSDFPTTFGRTKFIAADSTSDLLSTVLKKVYDVAATSRVIAYVGAKVVNYIVGAPTSRVDDLLAIYRILIPLAQKWKNIGKNLEISDEKLSEIEAEYGGIAEHCLRETLRVYLLKVDSYQHLAEVIKEYDHALALKILDREQIEETFQVSINS